ncbi:MAG: hypothetical protein ACOY4R_14200 [Pseudomonadota bacterium]
MERGLIVPLSPNEETALRQLAVGSTRVRPDAAARLVRLALAEPRDGCIRLTALGRQRNHGLAETATAPAALTR